MARNEDIIRFPTASAAIIKRDACGLMPPTLDVDDDQKTISKVEHPPLAGLQSEREREGGGRRGCR